MGFVTGVVTGAVLGLGGLGVRLLRVAAAVATIGAIWVIWTSGVPGLEGAVLQAITSVEENIELAGGIVLGWVAGEQIMSILKGETNV